MLPILSVLMYCEFLLIHREFLLMCDYFIVCMLCPLNKTFVVIDCFCCVWVLVYCKLEGSIFVLFSIGLF